MGKYDSRAEDNEGPAVEVTARSLRTLFESRSCITNKSCFPTGQWLDEPIQAYLRHVGVWDETKNIAGLPAIGQK